MWIRLFKSSAFILSLLMCGKGLQAQILVKVVPVVVLADANPLTFVCTVEPVSEVTIQSKVAGRIATLPVVENQHVKKAEVLVSLENSVAKLQMELSELQVTLNENTLKEALEALEDTRQRRDEEQKMFEKGTSSRQRLVALKLQLSRNRIIVESARIRVLVALKELQIRKESYADTMIRSPIAGIITQRFHEPGEVVGTGSALLEVIDIDEVRVQCGIAEEEVGEIRIGQVVEFKVPAFPGRNFKGTVEKMAWKADPHTRRFALSVLAKNPKRLLRGGMTAQLLLASNGKGQPAIPPAALRNQAGISYVLVVVDDRLQRRVVGLLGSSKGLLKVSGNLKAGDRVVISPRRNIKEGQKVSLSSS